MCMLTFLPSNIQPDASELQNGGQYNNDGHGYAIVVPATTTAPARMIVRHSLDLDALILQFLYEREQYPSGPALFHSRYGTGGSNDLYNCHPFTVAGDERTVVAHNGILPNKMQPAKGDRRCDTRLAADTIFTARYGNLKKKAARNRLGNAIGAYNKLVFLTIDPAYPEHAYLINEHSGIWTADNRWYSNTDYMATKWYAKPTTNTTADLEYVEDCRACKAKDGVNPATDACDYCDACADCLEPTTDCLCWTPANIQKAQDDPHYADSLDYADREHDDGYDYYARDYAQGYSPVDAMITHYGKKYMPTAAEARAGVWAAKS